MKYYPPANGYGYGEIQGPDSPRPANEYGDPGSDSFIPSNPSNGNYSPGGDPFMPNQFNRSNQYYPPMQAGQNSKKRIK